MKLIIALGCNLFAFISDPARMQGVLQIGLRVITEGLNRLNQDAKRFTLILAPDSTDDTASAMVDLKRDALGIRASATIARACSDLY